MSWPQNGDLAIIPAAMATECTPEQNDAAVRAVLRCATRVGGDLPDVADVCAALGIDLSGALQRARAQAPA